MDIWAWVRRTIDELRETGHDRLAELMEAIPRAVVVDDLEQVDAMVPEALGLARSLNLPWVEIYVRHWHLQARGGGFAMLDDAVELLEFSHREEHIACPQSVCTVQDLAIAYAGADGPGYAQERLDVSTEAMARIDATWPCFGCIVSERASALVDLGRYEEAVEFVERSRPKTDSVAADEDEADALLALGRPEEALELLASADRRRAGRDDDTFARRRRLRRMLALLALGRAAEAREELLPFELVVREPSYSLHWAQGVAGLVDAGEHDNDWSTGSALERLLALVVERGRAWEAVELAALHGRLALARDARVTAAHALAIGHEQAQRLRDPERGERALAELERALSAAPDGDVVLPDAPETLLEELSADQEDPERLVERLAAGRRRWPDSLVLADAFAMSLGALGREAEAGAVLRDFAERHPEDGEAWLAVGHGAVRARDRDALALALEHLEPLNAAWLRALMAHELDDHATAAAEARRVVELEEGAMNARRLWVHSADRAGDWATALEQCEALLERVEDADEVVQIHWARRAAATALGAWEAVRESAAAVGMEVPGTGPIDERWGPVNLSFGAQDIVAGERTGPATGRVLTVAPPGEPQRAGSVVLFDTAPLNPDAGEDEISLVRVRAELEPSVMRSFAFDAVDPGEEPWLAFRARLEEEGWMINSYVYAEHVDLSYEGEPCRGVYGYVAVPEPFDAERVHKRMTELAAPLPCPMIWPHLAEEAGDEATGREQRELAGTIGLIPD